MPSAPPSPADAWAVGAPGRSPRSRERIAQGRARLRRRWFVPVLAALITAGIVLLLALRTGTAYVGRSALELVSSGNTPGDESVLVQGYADYFDQATTQSALKQRAGVPESVTLDARVAAGSPILYVEATAPRPEDATAAAGKIATAFRDQVEQSLVATWPAESLASDSDSTPITATFTVLALDDGTDTVRPSPSREMLVDGVLAALIAAWVVASVPERRPKERSEG